VVGDIFDFIWKANACNIKLLREQAEGRRSTFGGWFFLFALLAILLGLITLLLFAIYSVINIRRI